jgi:hypothetical protein
VVPGRGLPRPLAHLLPPIKAQGRQLAGPFCLLRQRTAYFFFAAFFAAFFFGAAFFFAFFAAFFLVAITILLKWLSPALVVDRSDIVGARDAECVQQALIPIS